MFISLENQREINKINVPEDLLRDFSKEVNTYLNIEVNIEKIESKSNNYRCVKQYPVA